MSNPRYLDGVIDWLQAVHDEHDDMGDDISERIVFIINDLEKLKRDLSRN